MDWNRIQHVLEQLTRNTRCTRKSVERYADNNITAKNRNQKQTTKKQIRSQHIESNSNKSLITNHQQGISKNKNIKRHNKNFTTSLLHNCSRRKLTPMRTKVTEAHTRRYLEADQRWTGLQQPSTVLPSIQPYTKGNIRGLCY